MMFKKHPELYALIIPAVAVPIMLYITFLFMGVEVSVRPIDDCFQLPTASTSVCPWCTVMRRLGSSTMMTGSVLY